MLLFWSFLARQRHNSLSVFMFLLSCFLCSEFLIPSVPFPLFFENKSLAAGIAKASDTQREHLGNLTVRCWVQHPSSWPKSFALQSLGYLSPWRPISSESFFNSICSSSIMEASSHLFCSSIKFSEGLQEAQNECGNRKLSALCYAWLRFCPQAWCSSGTKHRLHLCWSCSGLLFPVQQWEYVLHWHKLLLELKPLKSSAWNLRSFWSAFVFSCICAWFLRLFSSRVIACCKNCHCSGLSQRPICFLPYQ